MDRTGTQTQARPDTHFGALLRRYRRRAGLTQEQLAERALLSDRAVGDLERQAARLPRLETATLLADALALQGAERDTFLAVARGETPSATALPPPTSAAPPPPAPALVAPTVFPGTLTTLVGREHEEAAIAHLLGEARLLTLTGPGGVGKTRLALRAAETLCAAFPDGVVVVPLAAVRVTEHVLPAIAQALGLTDEGARGAAAVLYAHLQHRRLLLVLDNFEQVAEVASELVSLLLACPDVRALVTSRVALRVQGEQELAVRPLAVPAPALPLAAVRQAPAVQLFEQRARAVHPDFALTETTGGIVAEICRRLDGLPLALELAAARLKLLPPAALLAHLERGLGALSTLGGGGPDRPDRHRTLRATIAWSYDLLGPSEQTLFRHLAVFTGGWTLEATEAINPAAEMLEGLAALVDHSLIYLADAPATPHAEVAAAHTTEARYGMLETVRAYGLEQLEQNGEAEAAQRAHARYLVAVAEQAEAALHGPDQRAWLARLQREHDNLRAVLSWTRQRGEAELGLRIAAALQRYWELHGHLREALDWLGGLLPLAGAESVSGAVQAKGLRAGGVVAYRLADYARATSWLEQSLALYRDLGDQRGVANVLSNLGNVALATGNPARAARCYGESATLNRALGSPVGLASALNNLAEARRQQGRDDEAQALYEQSLALYQEVDDTWSIASVLNNLGGVALDRGDYATAETLYERSLALRQKLGNEPGIALVLGNLARASLLQGRGQRALALYTQGLEIHRRVDTKVGIAQCLEGLAEVACAQGEFAHVVTLCSAAAALRSAINTPLPSPSQTIRDGILATARERLGDDRFYQAEAAGRAAPLERLIAEALGMTAATAERPAAG